MDASKAVTRIILAQMLAAALILSCLGLGAAIRDGHIVVTAHFTTGGFTQTEVAAMSTAECEARFCACTNDGGYGASTPMAGWDSPNNGDVGENLWRYWLEALLWPEEYPVGYPATYCSSLPLAVAGAARVGITFVGQNETADQLVRRVLYTVGH